MFKKLMKKQFIKVRDGMYQNDLKNIEKQKDNTTIDVSEFQYFEDNHPMHKLNIYTSKDLDKSKSYPLIIDIHGGGWIYGDKDLNGLLAMEFASKGYIVMTMSYRLILDDFTICDMLFDINEAITYIAKNASNFNIDLNKVSLMGDSAGGHLALLISAIYNSTFLESTYKINKANIKFQNIILNHPAPFIHTVNLLKDKKLINKFIERYFNLFMYGKFYKHEARYIYADVRNFINYLPKDINYYVISSTNDTVCGYQYYDLIALFKAHEFNYETYLESDPSCGHVYNVTQPFLDISKKCNDAIDTFIKKHI